MKKNGFLILMFFILIIVSTSCKSAKEISMFQEMEDKEYLRSNISNSPLSYKIKIFDNLYLSILTLDTEVNQMLNPGLSGGGNTATSQTFGSGVGQYINGYQVNSDSTISLPILGKIKIAGLTLEDANNAIRLKAEEYLKEPTVQVKLLNYKLNILGEVNSPGIYYNYEGRINIIEALGMANGTTKYANLKQVVVNRQIDNVSYAYKVDLTDNNLYKSEVFYLQPYDLVYVPPSKLVMRNENVGNYSIFISTITSLLVIASFFGVNF